jgi:estrogen-related receptor beta like 1
MDDLDRVKQQMEAVGSSMTDTAPLLKLKDSMSKLREEIAGFDLRIGILDNTLMQAKIRAKRATHSTQ